MPQDTPPLLVLVRNCHGTALETPWVSLGSGVFPSCRQGAAEPPQRLHPACWKSRERVRSVPRAATIPGVPTEGASKHAKLSKSGCGIQRWSHGLQAHVLMHKRLSSALGGFHQPVGCSTGLLPPCILPQGFAGFHLPYWETKAKRNTTAFLLFLSAGTACECRGSNSSGTWSWKAFSSQTRPKPQQLALCCSFIHGVIFGFLLLGEQDSFCFQCSLESSLLRE